MTRNGTFCFCADGFEVGEDGTSCRGKNLYSRYYPSHHGALPIKPRTQPFPKSNLPTTFLPFSLIQISFIWISMKSMRANCLQGEPLARNVSTSKNIHFHAHIVYTACIFLSLSLNDLHICQRLHEEATLHITHAEYINYSGIIMLVEEVYQSSWTSWIWSSWKSTKE